MFLNYQAHMMVLHPVHPSTTLLFLRLPYLSALIFHMLTNILGINYPKFQITNLLRIFFPVPRSFQSSFQYMSFRAALPNAPRGEMNVRGSKTVQGEDEMEWKTDRWEGGAHVFGH